MKQPLLFILFLAFFCNARAQDTITKKSGETVIAKILEIGTSEIKYKRSDITDGPVFIESKSAIAKISYSNGVKEIFKDEPVPVSPPVSAPSYYSFQPMNEQLGVYGNLYTYHHNKISENQLFDILNNSNDRKIMSLVADAKNAKSAQYIGFGAIPFGLIGYYFFMHGTGELNITGQPSINNNGSAIATAGLFLAAAIACPVASGIFKQKRRMAIHTAVTLYNEKY